MHKKINVETTKNTAVEKNEGSHLTFDTKTLNAKRILWNEMTTVTYNSYWAHQFNLQALDAQCIGQRKHSLQLLQIDFFWKKRKCKSDLPSRCYFIRIKLSLN